MTAQALYRKWRPRTFEEVVGQDHVVRTLRNALISGRTHHAYLFAGPRGTGKTTTARLLAKAVNCRGPEHERPCNECTICVAVNEGRLLDLIEIDAASNTGVDDVRELRERVGFRPNEAQYKVYVIDEVHMLSNAAFNALLKTLEEPPEHAIFVLATTEPDKILPTVLSRCQRFDFHRISVADISSRLRQLAEREELRVDQEALELIARQATGSMRDAESLLDQLAAYDDQEITVEHMRAALGIGADETVMEITDALAQEDIAGGLGALNRAVDSGTDPRQFARQIVEHLRALLLMQLDSDLVLPHVSEDMRPLMEVQTEAFSRRQLVQAVQLFNRAAQETKGGWQPQLPLEMAFIEAVLPAEPERTGGRGNSSGETSNTSRSRRGATQVARKQRQKSSSDAEVEREGGPAKSDEAPVPEQVRESAEVYRATEADEGPLTLEHVVEHWSGVLTELRPRDLSLEALVRTCQLVDVEDDVIVLSFSRGFLRSKVEEDRKRRIVEDVLSDMFGRRLRIRCVTNREPAPGSAQEVVEEPDTIGAEDGAGASAADPLVQMAVDELGAEVVADHPGPRDS